MVYLFAALLLDLCRDEQKHVPGAVDVLVIRRERLRRRWRRRSRDVDVTTDARDETKVERDFFSEEHKSVFPTASNQIFSICD